MKLTQHVPILTHQIVEALMPAFRSDESAVLLDCTLGGGGHTAAFLEALKGTPHRVFALDRDSEAIDRATNRFQSEVSANRLCLFRLPFADAGDVVKNVRVMGLVADLGLSSDQLESAERGFSIRNNGPLDMRMDQSSGPSALHFLKEIEQSELENVFRTYGEERFSGRIARKICESREANQLPETTLELAELIRRAVPPKMRNRKIHPATRCFQALRIVLNGELEQLDQLLEDVIMNLELGGRLALLSFHSLEDRRVKNALRGNPGFKLLNKKVIRPTKEELQGNPRARSARLRLAERKEI